MVDLGVDFKCGWFGGWNFGSKGELDRRDTEDAEMDAEKRVG
jgi:hypothetical protein